MLNSLRFVKGAVSTKNYEPALKHFQIKDGRVQAYNGLIALSTPIDCDLDVRPLANPFVHAIGLCTDTVALHVTESGRLAVRSEGFKVFIDCTEEEFPGVEPVGDNVDLDGSLLQAVEKVEPFMGTDASHPWSHGILFAGQSAFATNNILLVEHWLGYSIPTPFGVPAMCVKELLRIGEEPVAVQSDGRTVTFHFEGGRWLHSKLLVIENWPDPHALLDGAFADTNIDPQPVPEEFFNAVEKLRPFTDSLNTLHLNDDGVISTADIEDTGAHLEITPCTALGGAYSADQLLRLRGVANSADWSFYPKPCPFFGDMLRGVLVGLRK